MKIVAISDTHAPRRWKSCPPRVAGYLRGADLILHAGDVCTASVLDELAGFAPVHAVLGNNDGAVSRTARLACSPWPAAAWNRLVSCPSPDGSAPRLTGLAAPRSRAAV
jgi:putative phosphoesterase